MHVLQALTLALVGLCILEQALGSPRPRRAIVEDDLMFKVRANYRSNGKVRLIFFRCSVLGTEGVSELVITDTTTGQEMGRVTSNSEFVSNNPELVVTGAVDCSSDDANDCNEEEGAYIKIFWDDIIIPWSDEITHRNYRCDAGAKSIEDQVRVREEVGSELENRDARTPDMFLKLRGDFRSNKRIRNLFFRCSAYTIVGGWDSIRVVSIKNVDGVDIEEELGVVNATGAYPQEKIEYQPRSIGSVDCGVGENRYEKCNNAPDESGFIRIVWTWILRDRTGPPTRTYVCEARKGDYVYSVDASVRLFDDYEF